MKKLIVNEVGSAKDIEVEAANDYYAVAEVANCAVNDVPQPIWRQGGTRSENLRQIYAWRCYMPDDNTGRQWIVRDSQDQS